MPRKSPSKSDTSIYKPDKIPFRPIRPSDVYFKAAKEWDRVYLESFEAPGMTIPDAAKAAQAAFDKVLKDYDERYR